MTYLQSVKCLLMTLHFFQKWKILAYLSDLNYDLETINQWVHQWERSFNPDPNKQATELLFSRKVNSDDHPKLTFNGNQVQQCSSQKHLGLFLDNKLDFNKHLDEKINKSNKIIGMMKKLSPSISGQSLLTIYKSFTELNVSMRASFRKSIVFFYLLLILLSSLFYCIVTLIFEIYLLQLRKHNLLWIK